MRTVVYCCPFIPAEWITAHGFIPRRIIPHITHENSQLGTSIGVCPYARAFIQSLLLEKHVDAAIITTVCDQMRRVWELAGRDRLPPFFLMNVPSTWQTELSQKMYRDELLRLSGFLVQLGGMAPTGESLIQIMKAYADRRSSFLNQTPSTPARIFAESLSRLDFEDKGNHPGSTYGKSQIPLALIGSPWIEQHFSLYDQIESAGGMIALDATGNGERMLPGAFVSEGDGCDPLTALVQAYFGHIPDAFRRPNIGLGDWLQEKINARRIKGMIYVHYVWCDTWHGEIQNLLETITLPSLVLELGDNEMSYPQIGSRIEAFLERFR